MCYLVGLIGARRSAEREALSAQIPCFHAITGKSHIFAAPQSALVVPNREDLRGSAANFAILGTGNFRL